MSNENFSWKSIFINDNNKNEKQTSNVSQNIPEGRTPVQTQFPTTPTTPDIPVNSNNPFISDVFSVYEKGFEGLNNEGFDFFELYKSVMAVGPTNPQSYQMAFAMGKTLRPEITKEFLLDKSKYYISEIEKVFQNYDVIGNSKQNELNSSITHKKENLNKEIGNLQQQIATLQNTLQAKSAELSQIDNDNKQQFLEIQQKIEANNIAKQKILESINTVIAGINQHL